MKRKSVLRWLLAHPFTRGLALDDPATTVQRRLIVKSKGFLRRVYEEWYDWIVAQIPAGPGAVLELGSGGGFLNERLDGLITSEVFLLPGCRIAGNGLALPFRGGALRAIVMLDVFHHIPEPRSFFREAARCVRPGGIVAMIEPWVSTWSRWIYSQLHEEPFLPDVEDWEFASTGPVSGANGALPWLVFERDRSSFEREFPEWEIQSVQPTMPFRYLLAGGVSLRSLNPEWAFSFWKALEELLEPWRHRLAMFARIQLRRRGEKELQEGPK